MQKLTNDEMDAMTEEQFEDWQTDHQDDSDELDGEDEY
jgi:hypothetical protein